MGQCDCGVGAADGRDGLGSGGAVQGVQGRRLAASRRVSRQWAGRGQPLRQVQWHGPNRCQSPGHWAPVEGEHPPVGQAGVHIGPAQ